MARTKRGQATHPDWILHGRERSEAGAPLHPAHARRNAPASALAQSALIVDADHGAAPRESAA